MDKRRKPGLGAQIEVNVQLVSGENFLDVVWLAGPRELKIRRWFEARTANRAGRLGSHFPSVNAYPIPFDVLQRLSELLSNAAPADFERVLNLRRQVVTLSVRESMGRSLQERSRVPPHSGPKVAFGSWRGRRLSYCKA